MCQLKEQVLATTSSTAPPEESSRGHCNNVHDKGGERPVVTKKSNRRSLWKRSRRKMRLWRWNICKSSWGGSWTPLLKHNVRTTASRCSCFKNVAATGQKRSNKIVVLDMDETLIHTLFVSDSDMDSGRYEDEAGFFVDVGDGTCNMFVKERPGLHEFLQKLSQRYEIHIFTAGGQIYADAILDTLEGSDQIGRYFTKRWYRQDCTRMYRRYESGKIKRFLTKNLDKITDDFGRILLVDDNDDNFHFQPHNGYRIPSFYGDSGDMELHQLEQFIARMDSQPDVRMWQYQALHLKNDQCHYLPDFARKAGPPRSHVMNNRGLSHVPSPSSSCGNGGTDSNESDDSSYGRRYDTGKARQLDSSGIVVRVVESLTWI